MDTTATGLANNISHLGSRDPHRISLAQWQNKNWACDRPLSILVGVINSSSVFGRRWKLHLIVMHIIIYLLGAFVGDTKARTTLAYLRTRGFIAQCLVEIPWLLDTKRRAHDSPPSSSHYWIITITVPIVTKEIIIISYAPPLNITKYIECFFCFGLTPFTAAVAQFDFGHKRRISDH